MTRSEALVVGEPLIELGEALNTAGTCEIALAPSAHKLLPSVATVTSVRSIRTSRAFGKSGSDTGVAPNAFCPLESPLRVPSDQRLWGKPRVADEVGAPGNSTSASCSRPPSEEEDQLQGQLPASDAHHAVNNWAKHRISCDESSRASSSPRQLAVTVARQARALANAERVWAKQRSMEAAHSHVGSFHHQSLPDIFNPQSCTHRAVSKRASFALSTGSVTSEDLSAALATCGRRGSAEKSASFYLPEGTCSALDGLDALLRFIPDCARGRLMTKNGLHSLMEHRSVTVLFLIAGLQVCMPLTLPLPL